MDLNEHQERLLTRMLQFIQAYRRAQFGFSRLVGELEGAFIAGEFKDPQFFRRWSERWGMLEQHNAVRGDAVNPEEVVNDLEELKDFIERTLHGDTT